MDALTKIADAVLYEGYVLWPYRRSALKNHRRFTFGGVYPRAHSEGRDDDPWTMQTQVLVEGPSDTRIEVRVRFLHVVERALGRQTAGRLESVDELIVGGERYLAWQEATERELVAGDLTIEGLGTGHAAAIDVAAGSEEEPIADAAGERAGTILRSWEPLEGTVAIGAERVGERLHRLTIAIANTTPWHGDDREQALRRTFCSTHTVIRASGGDLVSLTDPPQGLAEQAGACRNEGTWPVLVGEQGERHTLLSSPIILEDYPRIAPESPGDLFDGGEIDQLLVLNILSLTDEEKDEMRASDPRAREILDRTESLSQEELMSLHGAVRELRHV